MSRMVACRVGVVAAVISVLVSCSGGSSGSGGGVSGSGSPVSLSPSSESPSSESPSSEVSSSQPSKSVTPSGPQPSETFTPEQLEAANTVIEYFRILDEALSNPNADPQALKEITTGQAQEQDVSDINEYRDQGKTQTGTVIVRILGAEGPEEIDGLQVTAIEVCTDARNIDVIDSKTGKTVLKPGKRSPYLRWNINVVKLGENWRVRENTNDIALGCHP